MHTGSDKKHTQQESSIRHPHYERHRVGLASTRHVPIQPLTVSDDEQHEVLLVELGHPRGCRDGTGLLQHLGEQGGSCQSDASERGVVRGHDAADARTPVRTTTAVVHRETVAHRRACAAQSTRTHARTHTHTHTDAHAEHTTHSKYHTGAEPGKLKGGRQEKNRAAASGKPHTSKRSTSESKNREHLHKCEKMSS